MFIVYTFPALQSAFVTELTLACMGMPYKYEPNNNYAFKHVIQFISPCN